jgi:hypothetical protein
MQFYVRKVIGSDEGRFIRLFTIHVEKFPLPVLANEKQQELKLIVDKILSAKEREAEVDVCNLEKELDKLVYSLYGLTQEEIKIVEGEK